MFTPIGDGCKLVPAVLCCAVLQLLPEVPHGWLIQEVTPDTIRTAQQPGFEMVCPRANALTAEGVQLLKQARFAVRAWGVKNLEVRHDTGVAMILGHSTQQ